MGSKRGEGADPAVGGSGTKRRMLPYCVYGELVLKQGRMEGGHTSLCANTNLRLNP